MNIRYLRNTKVFPAALQQISCVNSSGSRIDLRGAWTLEGGRGAWPGPNPKNPMKMKEFSQTFPKVYFFTECRGRGGLGPPAPPLDPLLVKVQLDWVVVFFRPFRNMWNFHFTCEDHTNLPNWSTTLNPDQMFPSNFLFFFILLSFSFPRPDISHFSYQKWNGK